MKKPYNPGSNVHYLDQACHEAPAGDVLGTLYEALKCAERKRPDRATDERIPNAQRIEGEGNIQLAGETAPLQSITGNNNIQIGALQLVVNVMMNVER